MRIQNMKMKTDNLMSGSGEELLIVESSQNVAQLWYWNRDHLENGNNMLRVFPTQD